MLDCELGAVSAVWRSTLAPRADCDDGCAGPDSGAPRCERARCVATHRDGSVMPECSGREVAFETAEPMLLVASARERMQTTSEARPHPYAFIALHNPTDQEQRVQLFATAVWVERSGGQAALPLAPERMSLRPPEDESPAAEETHASWLEFTSLPAGARREVVVQFAELPQSVPENRFPYRIRVTLRDSEGRMSAVDTQIRRGTRLPRR